MYTCPKGHQSAAGDYCDECGAPIAGAPDQPAAAGTETAAETEAAAPAETPAAAEMTATAATPCPQCGAQAAGRFCEVCGYDFLLAKIAPAQRVPTEDAEAEPTATAPPNGAAAPGWRIVVTADADYHARMQAQAEPDVEPIALPAFCPERRFALPAGQALIGRRSRSRGIEPDIDLAGPPADPAVSHAHALLIAQPDGGWAVVDLESANGTFVGETDEPIESNTPTPLADGDAFYLGAWTKIVLHSPAAA
jgi:pSer/pThr/pTyr-binding forkhead associated (FHA) protein